MKTQSEANPWAALFALCLGFFMIILDTTIVNVAVPSIGQGLNTGFAEILWVVNVYIMVYAVLLITAGRLGDIYGFRRVYLAGLVIFTVASALCGLAPSAAWLIAARVLQGVGGALLAPQTLAVLTNLFPRESRGGAFGVWGMVAGVAAIAGPTCGGLIVTTWGWHGIFLINLPIGVIAFFAARRYVPDLRPGRRHKLDLPGVGLASLGLFLIVFGLIESETLGWGAAVVASLIGGAVLLVLFILWERRQAEPLAPLTLFHDRCYTAMNAVMVSMAFGMLGLALLLPFYLQAALGMTALQAGLTMAPMSVVSLFAAPVTGRLSDRRLGFLLVPAGLLLYAAGVAWISLIAGPVAPAGGFLGPVALIGLGLGSVMAPSTVVAMRNVRPEMAGSASGVLNTNRQLGGTIGAAVVGAIFQARLSGELLRAGAEMAGQVPEPSRARFLEALRTAGTMGPTLQGLPENVAALAHRAFAGAFSSAFQTALHVTAGVVVIGAAVSFLATGGHAAQPAPERESVADV